MKNISKLFDSWTKGASADDLRNRKNVYHFREGSGEDNGESNAYQITTNPVCKEADEVSVVGLNVFSAPRK